MQPPHKPATLPLLISTKSASTSTSRRGLRRILRSRTEPPDAAGSPTLSKRAWPVLPSLSGWLPKWSLPAFLRAVRATVVVGGGFAFADQVIGNLQIATFAAFGGFATLVLSSFAGGRREKLVAHLALALAGSVLLTIGTAVTGSTLLAALVTVPVAFLALVAYAITRRPL